MTIEILISEEEYNELMDGNKEMVKTILFTSRPDQENEVLGQIKNFLEDTIPEDRVEIYDIHDYQIDVEIDEDKGSVQFNFDWHIYNGCKDLDVSEEGCEVAELEITEAQLKLSFDALPEREDDL